MKQSEQGLPEIIFFCDYTIPRLVVIGSTAKKHVSVGGVKVFDTGIIYSRVVGLQASSRQVDVSRV